MLDEHLTASDIAARLSDKRFQRRALATLGISQRSYRTGGITLPAARAKQQAKAGGGFESYRFAVFDRNNLPCLDCDTDIARGDITGRRIYWCPKYQAPC